jgi:glucans biosynthesis protein C
MGAFMAVSGLLAGLLVRPERLAGWRARRVRTLAVPLMTTVLVVCPAMLLLRMETGVERFSWVGLLFNWYHLWFLAALLAYLPLTAWWLRSPRVLAGFRLIAGVGVGAPVAQLRVLALTGSLSLLLMSLGLQVLALLSPTSFTILNYLPVVLAYAPIHLLGVALGRDAEVRRRVLGDVRLPAVALVLILAADLWLRGGGGLGMDGTETTLFAIFATLALPLLGSVLILRSALAIRRVPGWVAPLSAASFTIYLVHLPVVEALEALLHPWVSVVPLRYALVVTLGLALSWGFHAAVVARSATLSWLLNGRSRSACHEPRHLAGDLASQEAQRADPFGQSAAGLAMQPHAPGGGDLRLGAAGEQRADDPGQHVARSGGAEAGAAAWVA